MLTTPSTVKHGSLRFIGCRLTRKQKDFVESFIQNVYVYTTIRYMYIGCIYIYICKYHLIYLWFTSIHICNVDSYFTNLENEISSPLRCPCKVWILHFHMMRRELTWTELSVPSFAGENPMVTLPETNIFAPKNGWLEYYSFLLGFGLFPGAFAVSFRCDLLVQCWGLWAGNPMVAMAG